MEEFDFRHISTFRALGVFCVLLTVLTLYSANIYHWSEMLFIYLT